MNTPTLRQDVDLLTEEVMVLADAYAVAAQEHFKTFAGTDEQAAHTRKAVQLAREALLKSVRYLATVVILES